MNPNEIAKDIYDVGVIDWNIRDFHGYSTNQGTSYNAFLIVDEKIILHIFLFCGLCNPAWRIASPVL